MYRSQQCDTVWSACVFLGSAAAGNADSPSVIANIAQKCSGFANVWPTYYGVELAAGTTGSSVNNVGANPACGIPNSQLVFYDNPLDGTQTVSLNFAPQYCAPTQSFKPNRYYTTPFTNSSTFAVTANILYAIPVPIACTVTISQLSAWVSTGVTSARCEYGVYATNGLGQPGTLILDGGNQAADTSGSQSAVTGLAQRLAPGLVFLVVGCNAGPTLTAGSVTGTLLGGLIGLGAQNHTNATLESVSGAWNYATPGGLPKTFPAISYSSSDLTPLVFLAP